MVIALSLLDEMENNSPNLTDTSNSESSEVSQMMKISDRQDEFCCKILEDDFGWTSAGFIHILYRFIQPRLRVTPMTVKLEALLDCCLRAMLMILTCPK